TAAMRSLHIAVPACTFGQNAHIDAARLPSESPGYILFWLLAIAVTAIACAALYYAAAGRVVNASGGPVDDATTAHYRLQLREIDADIAAGRMGGAEGVAARAEMARELIRLKAEGRAAAAGAGRGQRPVLLLAIAATAVI